MRAMKDEWHVRPTAGWGVVPRLLGAVAAVVMFLVVADLVLRFVVPRADLLRPEVEINDSATLYAKIADLNRPGAGPSVVMLGDSLVLGRSLEQAGVHDWRSANLAAKLEPRLNHGLEAGVRVRNLGMDGALPADIARIADAVLGTPVSGIVLGVSLRHFSADFTAPDTVYSRRWLAGFAIDDNGRLKMSGQGNWLDSHIDALATNYWFTYRVRSQLRQLLLGASPYEAVRDIRDGINDVFRDDLDPFGSDLRLVLAARSRYETVSLSPDNPQVKALVSLLRKLRDAEIPTVVFYATERPDIVPEITDPELHRQRLAEIERIVRANSGPNAAYVGPLETLRDEVFIDHVHVLPEGYDIYAGALASTLIELLGRRRAD